MTEDELPAPFLIAKRSASNIARVATSLANKLDMPPGPHPESILFWSCLFAEMGGYMAANIGENGARTVITTMSSSFETAAVMHRAGRTRP